jgi:hypothetical protein
VSSHIAVNPSRLDWCGFSLLSVRKRYTAAPVLVVCALLLTGCVRVTVRPASELVAPLPGPDSEVVYDLVTTPDETRFMLARHQTPSKAFHEPDVFQLLKERSVSGWR